MVLDRDELAARCLVAMLGSDDNEWGSVGGAARMAVEAADALLARLRPVAPASGAPLAAATPWVPSVGDVVKHVSESDETALKGQIRVVVSTSPLRWVYVEDGKACGSNEPCGWVDDVRFVRPATSSERAAAGLPPAEATRSVDREGLMKAIHDAIDKWHGCSSDERDIDEVRADAAIAYFKNGGV